jgi:hypothetical protein
MDKLTGDKEVDIDIVTEEFLVELAGAWIASKVRKTGQRTERVIDGLLSLAVAVPALGVVILGAVALGAVPLAYNFIESRLA